MFKNQRDCFICAFIILSNSLQVYSQLRNIKSQPGSVEDILRMLYKNKEQVKGKDEHEYSYITTDRYRMSRRNENMLNTQKAALRDVLMMKLVSYYENKYKLSYGDAVTTESTKLGENDIFADKSSNDIELHVIDDTRKRASGVIQQNEYNPVADVVTI